MPPRSPAPGCTRHSTSHALILMLGALTALGSLSIHMIVPALPLIAAQFRVDKAEAQLTIGLYLVAIGIGQLAWGPIVDRFGRRPAMLGSIVLFCAGAVIAGTASSIEMLAAGRVIQALGSSGALVTARAIVADLSAPGRAVKGLATLATVTLISPAIAPGIGGLLVEGAGWRAIFLVLIAAGMLLLSGAWLRLPETGPAARPATGTRFIAHYAALARSRSFMGVTMGAAMWTAMMYHFLAASPFVLRDAYHLSPARSGLVYFGISAFMIGGTIAVRTARGNAFSMLKVAIAIMGLGVVLLIAAALGLLPGLTGLVLPMAICACASGISVPCALAAAQESSVGTVATASSLFGALQMLTAALAASTVSHLFDHGPALPASLAGFALLGAWCFLLGLPKRPLPKGP